MTISVPTSSLLVSTSVVDPTSTYNPNINMGYPTGTQIQYNGWIYENEGDSIVPIVWTATGYPDGTVVYKDGKLQLWYSSPTQRLAQPDEYAAISNGKYSEGNLFKADTWTEKYVNLGVVPLDQTLYDPDFVGDPADAAAYLFKSYLDDQGEAVIEAFVTHESADNEPLYTITSPGVYGDITDDTVEVKGTRSTVDGRLMKTLGTFFQQGVDTYMRTSFDADTEYIAVTGGYGVDITNISMMPGFVKKRPADSSYPFDNKNYTMARAQNTMTYTVKGTQKFDTIALGRVKADNVVIDFKDPLGAVVTNITRTIDTSRDADNNLESWYTTLVYYSDTVMDKDSTVEITLTVDEPGGWIELGSILLGMSVDAGFTKLQLTNSYVDYSVVETDQFGVVDYVERGKVSVYEGKVDIFIKDYDRVDRLMTSLGAKLIILNGSDAKNSAPDSQNIFSSTQRIGRLFNFKQMTQLKGKRLHQMATYTFTLKATI